MRLSRGIHILVVILSVVLAGCAARQKDDPCNPSDLSGCEIDQVDALGTSQLDDDDVTEPLATAETRHVFGGILEGVPVLGIFDQLSIEYERFDRFVLERDLARVERFYRRRGFYGASVKAGRVIKLEEDRVRIEILVDEGLPTRIRSVELSWEDWRDEDTKSVTVPIFLAKQNLANNERFDEDDYDATKKEIVEILGEEGFAYGKVDGEVFIDLASREADIKLHVTLGPVCEFGDITIVGLDEIPEFQVRTALEFKKGERFSTAKLVSAESALAEFNVFASTEFAPKTSADGQPPNPVVPVVLTVQEADLRAIRLGVGAAAGNQVETHLLFGWEDRNMTRLLDRLGVEIRPGLVFYPLQLSTLAEEPPFLEVLPHSRIRTSYRLPIWFDPRTSFTIGTEFNIARPLNADTPDDPKECPDPDSGQPIEDCDNILGYREYTARFGLERRFFEHLFLSPSYNIQIEDPFSYNLDEPPDGFVPLIISFLGFYVELDFRKGEDGRRDPISPQRGWFIATDVQVAGRFMGGDTADVRVKPEFRSYLPIGREVVLGFRFATGLLLAADYTEILNNPTPIDELRADDTTNADEAARSPLNQQRQKLEFRGFFSGGPNSNRGYAFNDIGPHAVLDVDGFRLPFADNIGGQTLWESSLEVRFPIGGEFGGVVFVDGSDVAAQLGDYRFDHPHLSTGVGLRYQTPVGPLRVDLGYRIPYLQVIGEEDVTDCLATETVCSDLIIDEADPGDIFGVPLAFAIAIGEAF